MHALTINLPIFRIKPTPCADDVVSLSEFFLLLFSSNYARVQVFGWERNNQTIIGGKGKATIISGDSEIPFLSPKCWEC